jgi:hypothetical protein
VLPYEEGRLNLDALTFLKGFDGLLSFSATLLAPVLAERVLLDSGSSQGGYQAEHAWMRLIAELSLY